jgi:hypothetical protein
VRAQRESVASGRRSIPSRAALVEAMFMAELQRTRIGAGTHNVFFAVYAPAGVGEQTVADHLENIRSNVLLVAPEAETELLTTVSAD